MTLAGAPAARRTPRIVRTLHANRVLYFCVIPFATLTVLFGLWPIAESIRVAFTSTYTALSPDPTYVGFENFRTIFADAGFRSSLWLTLLFTVLSVVLNVLLALALALLLAHPALEKGRTWFKLAMFLPIVTPDVASLVVWKWMFNQNFGVVNHVLLSLGLPPFAGVTQPVPAFITLMIVEAWHHVGLYALLFLTNLQLVDKSLEEAAMMDGAGPWRRLVKVVIPQLRPAITINTVYALIEFLKTFTVILVITKGGPNFSTNFISYFAYTKFQNASYGEATAMATVLFLAVFAIAAAVYATLERGNR